MVKKHDEPEFECPQCHRKVKPKRTLNRVKSEFIGARYTGKDKAHWLVCPHCKTVIGKK